MKNTKPFKKSLLITLSSIAFIIVLLLLINTYFLSVTNDENKPPTLESETGKYKGALVEEQFGFYEYEESDVTNYTEPRLSIFKNAGKGLNYFYPKTDLSVGEIVNTHIKPKAGLKVLFAYYSPEPTKYNTEDCFLVYPTGPYTDSCPIPFNEIYDFIIEDKIGFIIISNEEFEYNSRVISDANTIASSFHLNPPTDDEGWILRPLSPDVDLYNPNIQAVWLQTSPNEFEQIPDYVNIEVTRPYKMAWIKYKGETDTSLTMQEEGATTDPSTELEDTGATTDPSTQ